MQPPKFGDEGFRHQIPTGNPKGKKHMYSIEHFYDRVIIPLKSIEKKHPFHLPRLIRYQPLHLIGPDWVDWNLEQMHYFCIAVFHGFLNRFLGIPFEAENSSISWFPASALCINISQKNVFLHLQPVT